MALPKDPISGGHELTNSAGLDDFWSCPACYENHEGHRDGSIIQCSCGATLRLSVDYEPVCRATCIDPDATPS